MGPSPSDLTSSLAKSRVPMQNALSITNLSFTYHCYGDTVCDSIFEGLNLEIEAGSKTLLLAPFDKGKTTLAKIICGVCPKYFPGTLEGSLKVFGNDLSVVEPWQLLSECTYVSQNPQEQFVANSVEEEVAFPLESLGLSQEEMQGRVDAALKHWGLDWLRTSSAQELSGGERKRVLLAVTEAIDARFWILDEAFDDLDQKWRDQLKELIARGNKTVLVLASRYLAEFDKLFDQVLLLDDKKVVSPVRNELLCRFSQLCQDDLANPLDSQVCDPPVMRQLVCTDLVAERRRMSTLEEASFKVHVPHFTLQSGELVTLVGPNGSGKSSFSRILCGLDGYLGGSIKVDGCALSGKELSKKVGYLFQNPDLQIFLPTVQDELSWSLRRRRDLKAEEIRRKVGHCADLFGLSLSDTPATMSYPLRKALQAAVYYLLDRPFYILDELDSALTYHTALSIIRDLRQNGAGILLITHDKQFAERVEQRTYSIEKGRLSAL